MEFTGKKRKNKNTITSKEQLKELHDSEKEAKNIKNDKEDDEVSENVNENEAEFNELLKLFKIKNYGTSTYINLPHKSEYRMRAHCNPLSDMSILYPISPSQIDWSYHYGLLFENSLSKNKLCMNNTKKYLINYSSIKVNMPEVTHFEIPQNLPRVNILDIGCGFGGLLFGMSPYLKEGEIALGLEIRDKVTNYVTDRISVIRQNSCGEGASNISVVRTNAMKVILNYFRKGQIERMFFCFADPHFKKYTHRRRIIK